MSTTIVHILDSGAFLGLLFLYLFFTKNVMEKEQGLWEKLTPEEKERLVKFFELLIEMDRGIKAREKQKNETKEVKV